MAYNFWDWDKRPIIKKAKLVYKGGPLPPHYKKIYGFELPNGEVWYTWGFYQVVGFMAALPFLAEFKARFLGKGPSDDRPDSQPNTRHFEFTILSLPEKSKRAEKLSKKLGTMKPSPRGETPV